MSCSKTPLGMCSYCDGLWSTMERPRGLMRCAQCNEVVIVPLTEFCMKPDRSNEIMQRICGTKIIAWQQNIWPPEGNQCSRCHQVFDDQGICPCGIDASTGRPYNT